MKYSDSKWKLVDLSADRFRGHMWWAVKSLTDHNICHYTDFNFDRKMAAIHNITDRVGDQLDEYS